MRRTVLVAATTALLALSSIVRAADAPIGIAAEVPYHDGVGSESIRTQCTFGKDITDSIVRQARGQVVVVNGDQPATGKQLDVVITQVHATGSVASGPKWGRIYVELKENGRLVGNTSFQRLSVGRVFTFKTCTSLTQIADALGKDVAEWLRQPTLNPGVNADTQPEN